MRRSAFGAIVLVGLVAQCATNASAAARALVEGPAERHFAAINGITADESSRRLSLRMEAARLTGQIVSEMKGRYAGHDFSEEPMRVTVRLTGISHEPRRRFQTPYGVVEVLFEGGHLHSIEQLRSVLRSGKPRQLVPDADGVGVDVRRGVLYITVPNDGALRAASAERLEIERFLGVPTELRATSSRDRPLAALPIRSGGRAVNNSAFCTFGFRAYSPSGEAGIITAAHCPDLLRYESIPGNSDNVVLDLQVDPSRIRWDAANDVQWHPMPNSANATWSIFMNYFGSETVASLAEPLTDLVDGWQGFLILCHRGTRTGWSCGVLDDLHYQPGSSVCNNQECTDNWMKFSSSPPQELLCDGGDSGGPVVTNGLMPVAIVSGADSEGPLPGQCNYVIAMPLGRVQDAIGVKVN
ncbi:hypothetical protein [Stenotrophomonas sp. S4]